MEVHDRSPFPEELISQLWESNYFSSLKLKTENNLPVKIISIGQRNHDSGPDFKNITIKIDEHIYQGDLEIHRLDSDWYNHGHHHDSAYNNVILHLVIGSKTLSEPILRLNQQPVLAQVFVDISALKMSSLVEEYNLEKNKQNKLIACKLFDYEITKKNNIIETAGLERLFLKAERFKEERQQNSWNQIIYMGFMEALGYSKNQRPFLKLAQLLPIEVIFRELQNSAESSIEKIQAILFGVSGLLPSQDPRLLIKDIDSISYVEKLELFWEHVKTRIGVVPMKKEEWQFFRLRPSNFPTRRIAGVSIILSRFVKTGLLENILSIFNGLREKPDNIVTELQKLFVCSTEGYWAEHYLFEEDKLSDKQVTLIGQDRAKDIIVNIILPVIYTYAREVDNAKLKNILLQVYQQFPKLSSNQIIKKMVDVILPDDHKLINTALKQQGLIHLYKMYCRRLECERCINSVVKLIA